MLGPNFHRKAQHPSFPDPSAASMGFPLVSLVGLAPVVAAGRVPEALCRGLWTPFFNRQSVFEVALLLPGGGVGPSLKWSSYSTDPIVFEQPSNEFGGVDIPRFKYRDLKNNTGRPYSTIWDEPLGLLVLMLEDSMGERGFQVKDSMRGKGLAPDFVHDPSSWCGAKPLGYPTALPETMH